MKPTKKILLFSLVICLLVVIVALNVTCSLFDSSEVTTAETINWQTAVASYNWAVISNSYSNAEAYPASIKNLNSVRIFDNDNCFTLELLFNSSSVGPFDLSWQSNENASFTYNVQNENLNIALHFWQDKTESNKFKLTMTGPEDGKIYLEAKQI